MPPNFPQPWRGPDDKSTFGIFPQIIPYVNIHTNLEQLLDEEYALGKVKDQSKHLYNMRKAGPHRPLGLTSCLEELTYIIVVEDGVDPPPTQEDYDEVCLSDLRNRLVNQPIPDSSLIAPNQKAVN